jgi:O-antigen/teichoic acid export membrane protein
LVFALTARVVGVEDFGKLTFSVTFATLFLYLANFGLDRVVILEIARDNTTIEKYFSNIMIIKLFLSLATFLLIWILINTMGYPSNTRFLVYIFALAVILTSYTFIINSFFRGIEKLEYETAVTSISNIVLLITTLIVLAFYPSVMGVGLAYLFSRTVGFVHSMATFRRKVGKIYLEFDYQFSKEILRKVLPFALFSIIIAILYDIDTVLLSYLSGDQAVGYYQPPMKIITALTVIPFILDSSFFPVLSKSYEQSLFFTNIGKKLITLLFYIGIPLSVCIIVLSDKIIPFIYGPDFSKSIIIFQILAIVLLLRFLSKGYEMILLTIGKQKTIFYIALSFTFINIIFNLFSIPRFGILGAAISAVITSMLMFTSYIFFVWRKQRMIMIEKKVAYIILSALLPAIIIYNIESVSLLLQLALFVSLYLFLTLLFLEEERLWIFQAINSRINPAK